MRFTTFFFKKTDTHYRLQWLPSDGFWRASVWVQIGHYEFGLFLPDWI